MIEREMPMIETTTTGGDVPPVPEAAASLPGHGRTVCVTGAGGFIASWLVKRLLQKGYTVRGTVRNPVDPKNDHLRALEGAAERLVLVRADLLDPESLVAAFQGCEGVFHAASPVTDDPEKMIEPAIRGTRYVLSAAADMGIKRVVFTSTIGTVYMNPYRDADKPVDDTCWSDLDYCKKTAVYNTTIFSSLSNTTTNLIELRSLAHKNLYYYSGG